MIIRNAIKKINTGLLLGLCCATMANAAQRQSQGKQQRQQRQRQQQQEQKQRQQQEQRGEMSKHTAENLMRAIKREALGAIKYRVFAEVATENGNPELADLFLKTAETESDDHLRTLFGMAKIVGSDLDNLKDAIGNETYESSLMYRSYAEKARKAGDIEVAKKFDEMAKDESLHREAFIKMLDELRG